MDEYQESVMVALLPDVTDWSTLKLPHITLVYAGEIPDIPSHTRYELTKAAYALATKYPPQMLDVLGFDIFGEGESMVDVLLLRPTDELDAMYDVLEPWNKSKHPFNPHATVGPLGSLKDDSPTKMYCPRILVSWGTDNISFRFNGRPSDEIPTYGDEVSPNEY